MFVSPIPGASGKPAFFLSKHDNILDPPRREVLDEQQKKAREDIADRLRATLSLSGGAAAWEWNIKEGRIVGDARFAALYGLDFKDVSDGISVDIFYFQTFTLTIRPEFGRYFRRSIGSSFPMAR